MFNPSSFWAILFEFVFEELIKFDNNKVYGNCCSLLDCTSKFPQLSKLGAMLLYHFQTSVMWSDVDGCLFFVPLCYIFFNYLFYAADFKIFVVLCCFLFQGIIPITMIILKFAVATRQYMRFHLSKKTLPSGFQ